MLFAKSRSPRVPVATRNSRVPLARGHAIRQGPRPSPGSVPLATIALRLAYSTAYTPYTCPYVLMYAVLLDDRLDIIRRVCGAQGPGLLDRRRHLLYMRVHAERVGIGESLL